MIKIHINTGIFCIYKYTTWPWEAIIIPSRLKAGSRGYHFNQVSSCPTAILLFLSHVRSTAATRNTWTWKKTTEEFRGTLKVSSFCHVQKSLKAVYDRRLWWLGRGQLTKNRAAVAGTLKGVSPDMWQLSSLLLPPTAALGVRKCIFCITGNY